MFLKNTLKKEDQKFEAESLIAFLTDKCGFNNLDQDCCIMISILSSRIFKAQELHCVIKIP